MRDKTFAPMPWGYGYKKSMTKQFPSRITHEIADSFKRGEIDKNTFKTMMAFVLGQYIEDNFDEYFDELMYRYHDQLTTQIQK